MPACKIQCKDEPEADCGTCRHRDKGYPWPGGVEGKMVVKFHDFVFMPASPFKPISYRRELPTFVELRNVKDTPRIYDSSWIEAGIWSHWE